MISLPKMTNQAFHVPQQQGIRSISYKIRRRLRLVDDYVVLDPADRVDLQLSSEKEANPRSIAEIVPPPPTRLEGLQWTQYNDNGTSSPHSRTADSKTTGASINVKRRRISWRKWLPKRAKPKPLLHPVAIIAANKKPKDDTFTRVIEFEALPRTKDSPVVRGIAMIDTGCPWNVISRKFARNFLDDIESEPATIPFLECLNGQEVYYIKKIRARWYCKEDVDVEEPAFMFDPSMVESEFYIVDNDHIDVIIGKKDINRLKILVKGPAFAGPNFFRSKPPQIDQSGESNEPSPEVLRQQDAAEVRRHRDLKKAAAKHAHNYAMYYAQSYADAQAAKADPRERRRVHDEALATRYRQLYEYEEQRYMNQAHQRHFQHTAQC
jgi:hypothetical protein